MTCIERFDYEEGYQQKGIPEGFGMHGGGRRGGIGFRRCEGRCAAAERPVMAAIRVIPPCFAMGQAAGTAAALAVREGVGPKQLDPALLVSTLKDDGVYLPE